MISEKSWKRKISKLEKSAKRSDKRLLKKAIVDAIVSRIPNERFGVLFSGGVDSSLIALVCKQQGADFLCYTVGLKGSNDIVWAKKAAKKLGLKLKLREFSLDELKGLFKKTASVLRHTDVLSVGVGAVVFAGLSLAKKDKVRKVFTGLGSEELFAGYHWHRKCKDVNAECWKRLKTMWRRDVLRDSAIAEALGMELLVPFLDEKLIIAAMGIPASRKLNNLHNKLILREIALDLGLPRSIAFRPKKAAQYGSRFDWALAKIAREQGFRAKKDFVEKGLV